MLLCAEKVNWEEAVGHFSVVCGTNLDLRMMRQMIDILSAKSDRYQAGVIHSR